MLSIHHYAVPLNRFCDVFVLSVLKVRELKTQGGLQNILATDVNDDGGGPGMSSSSVGLFILLSYYLIISVDELVER